MVTKRWKDWFAAKVGRHEVCDVGHHVKLLGKSEMRGKSENSKGRLDVVIKGES